MVFSPNHFTTRKFNQANKYKYVNKADERPLVRNFIIPSPIEKQAETCIGNFGQYLIYDKLLTSEATENARSNCSQYQ